MEETAVSRSMDIIEKFPAKRMRYVRLIATTMTTTTTTAVTTTTTTIMATMTTTATTPTTALGTAAGSPKKKQRRESIKSRIIKEIKRKKKPEEAATKEQTNENKSPKLQMDGLIYFDRLPMQGYGRHLPQYDDVTDLYFDWLNCVWSGCRRNALWEDGLRDDVYKVRCNVLQRNLKKCGLV